MLKDKTLTYISLFSSAGVGCYGFKQAGYECVATNEIISRRMDVQKVNHKCRYDTGYICGDITAQEVKDKIYTEIDRWKKIGNDRIDVVIATPPCQGISVINHKKNSKDISRNSLVVDSVNIIQRIQPRFFIFENVMAFQKTLCITPNDEIVPIGEYVRDVLGTDYIINGNIFNFMNYGSNSSRTRTLMIGVNKEYRNFITPYDLFPPYRKEKTLRDVIYDFPTLEWGEICDKDFYHAFRTYDPKMRAWIHDLKEGESAFDNKDPLKRPHRIVNGKVVENIKKNRDKYTRQPWDRFIQCVHTRNDQLAAQNTIHPTQDRVYSIRELMRMMTIPDEFRWMDKSLEELNELSDEEKRQLYKNNEINIRQCIGEAVPTEIIRQIAAKIKELLFERRCDTHTIKKLEEKYELDKVDNLLNFIHENPEGYNVPSLMHIAELCNASREENAAYYTNKFIISEIMDYLPSFNKSEIHVLEPSVGAGGFLPFLFKKYAEVEHVVLDVIDIDKYSIEIVKEIISKLNVPSNFTIHYINGDFLKYQFAYKFDLIVGNPPFSVLSRNSENLLEYKDCNHNKETNNISEFFLEKAIEISDNVALILNKTILSSKEFEVTRDIIRHCKIDAILDFGRKGFTGVSIETVCMILEPGKKPGNTYITNMKYNKRLIQRQTYITDKNLPYFIIYRNNEFDDVWNQLDFGIFDVFRDRQITKSNTSKEDKDNYLWVIKARNINDDGTVSHIPGYDTYISIDIAKTLGAYKYVNDNDVYLTPNMTYNTRVIDNVPDVIPDGSVAVLIPKNGVNVNENQLRYFSTNEYRKFYLTARNLSTQSINVDKGSVYLFGVKNDE